MLAISVSVTVLRVEAVYLLQVTLLTQLAKILIFENKPLTPRARFRLKA